MVTHIVLFRLNEPAQQNAEAFREKLMDMRGRIDALNGIEVGLDEGKEPRSSHLSLITTHSDWDAFQVYQQHPIHLEVIRFAKPLIQSATSVDYTTSDH